MVATRSLLFLCSGAAMAHCTLGVSWTIVVAEWCRYLLCSHAVRSIATSAFGNMCVDLLWWSEMSSHSR